MRTEKVAITIPSDLVAAIDEIRSRRGISRSRFITLMLRQKVKDEQAREIDRPESARGEGDDDPGQSEQPREPIKILE